MRKSTIADENHLLSCELPDIEDEGEEFYWLGLSQKEGDENNSLSVELYLSNSAPEIDLILYVSSRHAFSSQSHSLLVLSQILQHVVLFFPPDPDLEPSADPSASN